MKKINFELGMKKEQFRLDVVRLLKNNDTITLETRFARPLLTFVEQFCMCKMETVSTNGNTSRITITDSKARFIPGYDHVVLEVIVPDKDNLRLVIEEE